MKAQAYPRQTPNNQAKRPPMEGTQFVEYLTVHFWPCRASARLSFANVFWMVPRVTFLVFHVRFSYSACHIISTTPSPVLSPALSCIGVNGFQYLCVSSFELLFVWSAIPSHVYRIRLPVERYRAVIILVSTAFCTTGFSEALQKIVGWETQTT